MTRRAHAQLASAPACACATTLSRPLQDLRVPGGRHGGRQEWACWKDSSHTVHSTSAISPEFMLCGPCLVLSCLDALVLSAVAQGWQGRADVCARPEPTLNQERAKADGPNRRPRRDTARPRTARRSRHQIRHANKSSRGGYKLTRGFR